MTIQWGREIPVDGVRPEWLADDVNVNVKVHHEKEGWWSGLGYPVDCLRGWPSIIAIRLPADHFAYKALDAGFEPWGGGDAAPADWDESEDSVLFRSGRTTVGPVSWAHPWSEEGAASHDVIGYRKRAEPVAPPAAQEGASVTIARMTEAEVDPWMRRNGWSDNPRSRADVLDVFRDLGLIRDETALERFARETGTVVDDSNRAAIERALSWERAA